MASLNEEFQILIALVCESIESFQIYDQRKIAVSIGRSKGRGRTGIWAYVVPLRHPGGLKVRRGSSRGIRGNFILSSPSIEKHHPEALYLMSFLFPRFFILSPRERLETVVHELYHLHPTLRGDLRSFEGSHKFHGPTPAAYDRQVRALTDEAIDKSPWLMQHPLLAEQAEYFSVHKSQRLMIPRRVFVPESQTAGSSKISALPSVVGPPTAGSVSPSSAAVSPFSRTSAAVSPLSLTSGRSSLDLLRARFPTLSKLLGLKSPFKQSAMSVFILFFSLMLPLNASATTVHSQRSTPIFQSPSSSAEKVTSVSSGETLKFLKYSPSQKWVQVKTGGGKTGWMPAGWIKGAPKQSQSSDDLDDLDADLGELTQGKSVKKTNSAKSTTDDLGSSDFDGDISEDSFVAGDAETRGGEVDAKSSEFSDVVSSRLLPSDEIEKVDRSLDKFFAIKKGKFFEQPSKFAVRFGVIEPGDQLDVLDRSKSGKWLKVRLLLTGEEGWYPKLWIKLQREERLGRMPPGSLGIELGYGGGGTRFGFGPSLTFNLKPDGFMGRPRDRLEAGFTAQMFLGESLTKTNDEGDTFQLEAKYYRIAPVLRYAGSTPNGYLSGAIELGLLLTRSSVTYQGTTEEVIIASNIRPSATYFGASLGVLGFIVQSANFQYMAGLRIFFGYPAAAYFFLGPQFRF